MMVAFQRAWTMPMRRALPSCSCGVGPLMPDILDARGCGKEGYQSKRTKGWGDGGSFVVYVVDAASSGDVFLSRGRDE